MDIFKVCGLTAMILIFTNLVSMYTAGGRVMTKGGINVFTLVSSQEKIKDFGKRMRTESKRKRSSF